MSERMSVDGIQSDLAWSDYWLSGELHSIPGTYADNYGGETARFWATIFARLGAGAHVLDIGTGNGAIPKLILEQIPATSVAIDAIDAATIAPSWLDSLPAATRARVKFHGQVQAERMPFTDARFDLVVSQYGLEYSDWTQSLPELCRTLKSEGKIALVVHHPDSSLVRVARAEWAHADWLLRQSNLFATARCLVGPMSLHQADGLTRQPQSPASEQLRHQFNAIIDRLVSRASVSPEPALLQRCAGLVTETLGLARQDPRQALLRLDRITRSLASGRQRSADLITHIPTPRRIKQLTSAISKLRPRWNIEISPLTEGGHLLGQTILSNST